MKKMILYNEASRKALLHGINEVCDIIKATLGPRGRNVLLQKRNAPPVYATSGWAVIKTTEVADPFEAMGVRLLKEALAKTNEQAGDGTASTAVLARSMVRDSLRLIAAGADPMQIRRGMEKAGAAALDAIRAASVPVAGKADLARIAAVSAGDEEIGTLIGEVLTELPADSVITIEDSSTAETSWECVAGMRLRSGYISPLTASKTKDGKYVLEDPCILITDAAISSIDTLLPIIEQCDKEKKSLLIIADTVEGEALTTLLYNLLNNQFVSVCIKAPGFRSRRDEMMHDTAVLTGAQIISEDYGVSLEKADICMLGGARRVIVGRDETLIIGGYGDSTEIANRAAKVRADLEDAITSAESKELRERISNLSGGAIVRVGAATESQMHEKRSRAEAAVTASRAALQDGIVAGGGIAFLIGAAAADSIARSLEGDELYGARLVADALRSPIRQIAENAGKDGSVILHRAESDINPNYGYDADCDRFGDMFSMGIIDSARMCLSAVENSVSIISVLITSEAAVAMQRSKNQISEAELEEML